jgi:hypothetical protein
MIIIIINHNNHNTRDNDTYNTFRNEALAASSVRFTRLRALGGHSPNTTLRIPYA